MTTPPPETLTLAELDELERLERCVSHGPWREGAVETEKVFMPHANSLAGPGGEVCLLTMNRHFPSYAVDARLIAALRNAAPALLSLARRALVTEPVAEACLAHWEGEGICAICDYCMGTTPHADDCPFVVAGLITRSGARTEGDR